MSRYVDRFFKMLFTCAVGVGFIWFGSTITPWLAWMFYIAGICIVCVSLVDWNDMP